MKFLLNRSLLLFFYIIHLANLASAETPKCRVFYKELETNAASGERKTMLILKDMINWNVKSIFDAYDSFTKKNIDLYKIKLFFKPSANFEEILILLPIFLKKALSSTDKSNNPISFVVEKVNDSLVEIIFSPAKGTNINLEKYSENSLILKTYPKIYSDKIVRISST